MLESIEVPVTNGKKDGNQNFMTRNDLPGKFPGSKNCHNCHQAAFFILHEFFIYSAYASKLLLMTMKCAKAQFNPFFDLFHFRLCHLMSMLMYRRLL